MSMRGKIEDVTRKEDDICKKRRGRAMVTKPKWAQKKNAIVDEMKLGDSEGEEDAPIKWRYYEIETLIAIRDEMEEEFAKSARKQGIPFICVLYLLIFIWFNQKFKYILGQLGLFKGLSLGRLPWAPSPHFSPLKDLAVSARSGIEPEISWL